MPSSTVGRNWTSLGRWDIPATGPIQWRADLGACVAARPATRHSARRRSASVSWGYAFCSGPSATVRLLLLRVPLDELDANLVGTFDERALDPGVGVIANLVGHRDAVLAERLQRVGTVIEAEPDVIDDMSARRVEVGPALPLVGVELLRILDGEDDEARRPRPDPR